eukprot:456479_1
MNSHSLSKLRSSSILVNLWATPRSASTSLMYSFAQRKDTNVFDEPLYAHYLTNINPSAYRPYKEELLKVQCHNGDDVMYNLQNIDVPNKQVIFSKHMAKHMNNLDESFLYSTRNIILTRHPMDVFKKWEENMGFVEFSDTGYLQQQYIYNKLSKTNCIIITYDDLVNNPLATLRKLCEEYLQIDFDINMLRWNKGGLTDDGIWAYHWYQTVHESTGFLPKKKKIYILIILQMV